VLQRYATTFPVMCVEDMVRAQFELLDHLGIEKVGHVVIMLVNNDVSGTSCDVTFSDDVCWIK